MKKKLTPILVILALTVGSAVLVGCGEKDAEPSKETAQQSDRLSKIKKDSGGDWEKVSQADRDWLIRDICFGNEASARMMISGPPKPKGGPYGGPPGPPGGFRTGA